jgi:hypothetical protein
LLFLIHHLPKPFLSAPKLLTTSILFLSIDYSGKGDQGRELETQLSGDSVLCISDMEAIEQAQRYFCASFGTTLGSGLCTIYGTLQCPGVARDIYFCWVLITTAQPQGDHRRLWLPTWALRPGG